MVKVYDMVTYTLCGAEGDAPVLPTANTRQAALPQTGLALQTLEAAPLQREIELHPTLRNADIESFLAAFDG